MKKLSDITTSINGADSRANVSNAQYLMGDPDDFYGDIEGDIDEGDVDDYGDIEDGDLEDGDPQDDTLSLYSITSGDPDLETGGPFKRLGRSRVGRFAKKAAPFALGGLAAAGTYALGRRIAKNLQRRRAAKNRLHRKLSTYRTKQTLRNQVIARKYAGKIDRRSMMPFFQVSGASMTSSPIGPNERFIADMYKYNLDRQAADTPFYQEVAAGVAGVCTAVGVATPRFYNALIVRIGINALNGSPGTIFQITASLPLIGGGTLTVSTTPWVFTISRGFDVTFMLFPWQLVSNKPLPILGQYSSAAPANNIVVTVTGLPAASTVSLVVPGSLHPYTLGVRNALIAG